MRRFFILVAGAPRRKELWYIGEHDFHCASPASNAG
jgi:hypothetical protein